MKDLTVGREVYLRTCGSEKSCLNKSEKKSIFMVHQSEKKSILSIVKRPPNEKKSIFKSPAKSINFEKKLCQESPCL